MLGMHGIRYGLKHPEILKAELNALKKVAESGKKIGILLPQVINVKEFQEVKKILQEIQFKDAKKGVMVETPASIQIIKELCDQGVEFISFGTNDLTQYILAIDRGNEELQNIYNEMHPAVLYQLEYVIRVAKRNNVETSICGQAGSKKEMVKFLVEKGIDSISVNADVAADIAEYVKQLEEGKIVGTDQEPRKYQPEKDKEEALEEKKEPTKAEETHKNSENSEENIEEELTEQVKKETPEEKEERIERDVEEIEKEKQEYVKEHPEESEEENSKKELDIF
jgi:pyruvate,water dikinase